jgi:hypothetical protein
MFIPLSEVHMRRLYVPALLLGGEVIPVLRKEFAQRREPGVADAPTHASLVNAKYGDEPPRQVRPNPNRGDNVTGGSPYQDTESTVDATYTVP